MIGFIKSGYTGQKLLKWACRIIIFSGYETICTTIILSCYLGRLKHDNRKLPSQNAFEILFFLELVNQLILNILTLDRLQHLK